MNLTHKHLLRAEVHHRDARCIVAQREGAVGGCVLREINEWTDGEGKMDQRHRHNKKTEI